MPKRTDVSKILIIGSARGPQGLKPRKGLAGVIVAPEGVTFQSKVDQIGAARAAPFQNKAFQDKRVVAGAGDLKGRAFRRAALTDNFLYILKGSGFSR